MSCNYMHSKLGGLRIHYEDIGHRVGENGMSFELKNPHKNFCKINADKHLISPGEQRCDWIFYLRAHHTFCFVELKGKGSDISDAYSQIIATVRFVKRMEQNLEQKQIIGIIVGGRVPDTLTQRKLQEDFRKNHGLKLHRKHPHFSY